MATITKSASQTLMTVSGSPYAGWNDLELLGINANAIAYCDISKQKGKSSIPATIRCTNFGFNIPNSSIISSIKVSYQIRVNNNKVKVKNPTLVMVGGKVEIPSSSTSYLTTSHDSTTKEFKKGGTVVTNITPENINSTEFGIELDFLNNVGNAGTIYLGPVTISITYDTLVNYVLDSGETDSNFPTETNPLMVEVGSNINYELKFSSPTKKYTGKEKVTITIPEGLEVIDSVSSGGYSDGEWSPLIDTGNQASCLLTLRATTTGIKYIQSTSNVTGYTKPFYVYVDNHSPNDNVEENIQFSMPDVHKRKRNLYATVLIQSNASKTRQFKFYSNMTKYPWRLDEIIIQGGSSNISSVYKVDDETIQVDVLNSNLPFIANISIGFRTYDDPGTYNIQCTNVDTAKAYSTTFKNQVEEAIEVKFVSEDYYWLTESRQYGKIGDQTYVDGDYQIFWSTHEDDFYVDDSDLSFVLEKPYGYIGPIKLARGHSGAKNDTTNTLIKEQYQNRVRYGKVGDYTETRVGTFRLPPQQVVALQGLAKMDKTVPMDTVPLLADGDPLALRGWAELYAVKGIKKINEFLYECEPSVEFLTNEVCTRFLVQRGSQVQGFKFDKILVNSFTPYDKLTDFFNQTGNGTFSPVQHSQLRSEGIGYDYDNYSILNPNGSITFTSKDTIANISSIDFDWLNWLTTDNNKEHQNWKMYIRLLDASTGNIIMEYMYYDFVHIENDKVINRCKVRVLVRKDNQYKVLGYKNLYLDWGNTSIADEVNVLISTFMCNVTLNNDGKLYLNDCPSSNDAPDIIFNRVGDYLRIKLSADDATIGGPLGEKEIKFELRRDSNSTVKKTYKVFTDKYGVAKLQINLSSGDYWCTPIFSGDEYYNECTLAPFKFTVDITKEPTYLEAYNYNGGSDSWDKPIITDMGSYITAYLKSNATTTKGIGIGGEFIDFTLQDATKPERTKTYYAKTDSSGKASLQINLASNNLNVYVNYKGSDVYEPSTEIKRNTIIKLKSDNGTPTTLTGQDTVFNVKGKQHIVTLTDSNGNALVNKKIVFTLSWDRDTSIKRYGVENPIFTDKNGQAGLYINLNDGVYNLTANFYGDTGVTPPLIASETTNHIVVDCNDKRNTSISPDGVTIYKDKDHYIGGVLYHYPDGVIPIPYSGATVRLLFGWQDKSKTGQVYYDVETGSDGTFSHKMELQNGLFYCQAIFNGDSTHDGCSSKWDFQMDGETKDNDGNLINRPESKLTGEDNLNVTTDTTYVVTLKDANGKAIEGADITFDCWWTDSAFTMPTTKGKHYPDDNQKIEQTKAQGQTALPLHLTGSKGYAIIQATYAGTSTIGGSHCTNHFIINCVNDSGTVIDPSSSTDTPKKTNTVTTLTCTNYETTYTSRDSKYIGFKLLDSSGNPVIDKDVIFYWKRTTNGQNVSWYDKVPANTGSTGYVEKAMTLGNGTYEVYAQFNGDQDYQFVKSATTSFTVNVPEVVTRQDLTITGFDEYNEEKTTFDYILGESARQTDGWIKARFGYTDSSSTYHPVGGLPIGWKFIRKSGGPAVYYGCTKSKYDTGDTTEFTVQTIGNGFATDQYGYSGYDVKLGVGTYDVFVKFPGNDKYNPITTNFTLNVTSKASNSLLGSGIIGTDSEGNPIRYFNGVPFDSNGQMYGSSWHMDLDDGIMNIYDYGLTTDNGINAPKVLISGAEIDKASYKLQVQVDHPDATRLSALPDLKTQYWMNIVEDEQSSPYLALYNNIIISPSPVPNRACHFIRKTDEGILYYYDWQDTGDIDYVGTPYNQYKAGCDLQTIDGYSQLDTESGYDPICIANGMVKVAFHRLAQHAEIYRYDYEHKKYILVRGIRIEEIASIQLLSFNDDKIVIKFGKTIWTMWRGHPFVQVNHEDSDLIFVDSVDTAWCEIENNGHLGTPMNVNINKGYFDTYFSPNLFKYDLHLNDDFKLTNFKLYSRYATTTLNTSINNGIKNRKELLVDLTANEDYGEVFFPYPALIEKPSQKFTIYVGYVNVSYDCTLQLTLNEYTKNGRVQASTDPDPSNHKGYKQTKTIQLKSGINEIRQTFEIPNIRNANIEYIDFNFRFDNTGNPENPISMAQFMLYNGDNTGTVFTTNNPGKYYDTVKVNFKDNYYAKLFNKSDKYGLCVIKPYKDSFNLGIIDKSSCTVFAPYLKNAQKWDLPELVAIEYMTFSDQTIDINQVN